MLQTLLAHRSYYLPALMLHTGHLQVLSSLFVRLPTPQPQAATKPGIC